MATYLQGYRANNQERVQGAAVCKLDTVAKPADRLEDPILFADGDIIGIGALPAKCNVDKIVINVFSAYPADTTIDLKGALKMGGEFVDFVDIATGIKIDQSDVSIIVPIPTGGNMNADGSSYNGNNGNIWVGAKGSEIVAIFNEGSRPLEQTDTGNIGIVFSYTDFSKRGDYLR